MVRKGSRSSASTPSTSRDSSCKQKTLIGGDAETIMILLKNLAATTSAVVARLDRLEGAHFDARGPADLGAIGSTTIATPESIVKGARGRRFVFCFCFFVCLFERGRRTSGVLSTTKCIISRWCGEADYGRPQPRTRKRFF